MAGFLHVKNGASVLKAVLGFSAIFGLNTLKYSRLSSYSKYAINIFCRKSFCYPYSTLARLTGELSFLIGEKIARGLASLRSPIRF